jgi:hypothetical protein
MGGNPAAVGGAAATTGHRRRTCRLDDDWPTPTAATTVKA